MKAIKRLAILVITLTAVAASALAQDGGSVVRRRDTGDRAGRDKRQSAGAVVTDRMQNFFGDPSTWKKTATPHSISPKNRSKARRTSSG